MEPGQPVSDSLGQGHVLTSTRGSALLGCAAVALLVGLVGLSIARGFFGIVFGVIAVIAVVAFCVGVYERRHWEPLQLTFEQWPLQLGGSYSALVSRHAKTRARQRSLSFTSELSCFERVTYDQGDDTENERAFVHRAEQIHQGAVTDNVFRGLVQVDIPVDRAGPSMELEHNEITWRMEIDLPELSPFARRLTFQLIVAPALADAAPPTVQDSVR